MRPGFAAYQATDEAVFALFDRLRDDRLIPWRPSASDDRRLDPSSIPDEDPPARAVRLARAAGTRVSIGWFLSAGRTMPNLRSGTEATEAPNPLAEPVLPTRAARRRLGRLVADLRRVAGREIGKILRHRAEASRVRRAHKWKGERPGSCPGDSSPRLERSTLAPSPALLSRLVRSRRPAFPPRAARRHGDRRRRQHGPRRGSPARPRLDDLLLTPGNVLKVTERLAKLRGAAMKTGQLLSMDAGDVLTPELAGIMARLRADAEPMPQRQVRTVLDGEWGKGWEARFDYFSFRPIAAASIGQVHQALTTDGRHLAFKVQYPGVRRSIDADVDNVATLLRLSNLVPKQLDVAPLLGEAKRQLHEEADYGREAECLERFGALLRNDPAFVVPALHRDLTTGNVLAMTYVEGVPIEAVEQAPQHERDRVAGLLIDLALRELFVFRLMQTDPNLANYRYDRETGRIVLLDFGATRAFSREFAGRCRRLAAVGLSGDAAAARQAMVDIGFFDESVPQRHRDAVMAMFGMAIEPLTRPGLFDFGDVEIARTLRDRGMAFAAERDGWRVPPVDTLFLQRKFGGTYLLAARLKARLDVGALLASYL